METCVTGRCVTRHFLASVDTKVRQVDASRSTTRHETSVVISWWLYKKKSGMVYDGICNVYVHILDDIGCIYMIIYYDIL